MGDSLRSPLKAYDIITANRSNSVITVQKTALRSYSLLSLKYKLVFSEALRNVINDLFFLRYALGGEGY